jgi:hypothetical protein
MLGNVLTFLRKALDDHLRAELGSGPDPIRDKVVFIDGDQMDPLVFKPEAVSALLINLEEERVLRRPDLHVHASADGKPIRAQPDVRLILYLLFVARFKQYDSAWDHLSKIVEFLQSNPVFDPTTTPPSPANVEKLVLELATLRFAEQNEIWSALKATHHPSILYRAKLVVIHDKKPVISEQITEREVNVERLR